MSKHVLVALVLLVCAGAAQAQDDKDKKGSGFEYGMQQWQFWSPESYEKYGPHTWGDRGNWGNFNWKDGCPWSGDWSQWAQGGWRSGGWGSGGRGQGWSGGWGNSHRGK